MSESQVGNSPFMKRVLVPFWVFRIVIMVIEIAVYALTIGALATLHTVGDDDEFKQAYKTAIAILAVVEVIILICLILDIVCIIKRSRRTLTPTFFFATNLSQTIIYVILFILSMLSARTAVSIILDTIVLLSFIGLLIYASVIFHKYRNGTLRGTYAQAGGNMESHKLVSRSEYPAEYPSAYPVPAGTYEDSVRKQGYYDAPAPNLAQNPAPITGLNSAHGPERYA